MKYTKAKYNVVFSFVFAIILLAVSCYVVNPEKNTIIIAQENAASELEEDIKTEITTPEVSYNDRLQLTTFRSAIQAIEKFYKEVGSYSSKSVGIVSGGSLIELRQNLSIEKMVDNVNKKYYVETETTKTKRFGNDKSVRIVSDDGAYYINRGVYDGQIFTYPNETQQLNKEDFLNAWKIEPKYTPFDFNFSAIKTGMLVNTGNEYIVEFSLDDQDLFNRVFGHVVEIFQDASIATLQPILRSSTVRFNISPFGNIKKISTNSSFTCNLQSIGFDVDISGCLVTTEIIYGINNQISFEGLI